MAKLRIGHFGSFGHPVLRPLKGHPRAELVATCEIQRDQLVSLWGADHPGLDDVQQTSTLEELMSLCDAVVFCSPMRYQQPDQCIQALKAGKHVLAEKPCAFTKDQVDELIDLDRRGPARFLEMGGTTLTPALVRMREIVWAGDLGDILCVQALKSYPVSGRRPPDERLDAGLIMQSGIHGARAMQEVTGLTITEVMSYETKAGNLGRGELRMVASSICRFDNGAVGNMTMNYLNPLKFGSHGNDQLRLFGAKGMIEAVDDNSRLRIATGDAPLEDIEPAPTQPSYFDLFVEHVLDGKEMPLPLERELQSTLTVIAMNAAAKTGRAVTVPVLR